MWENNPTTTLHHGSDDSPVNVSRLNAGRLLTIVNASLIVFLGSSSGSKFKGPELSIKGAQHVIRAGQTLNLTCR